MTDRKFPSEGNLIDSLRVNYDIEVKSITPLSGGADMNAVIYKVQTREQSSYFVKLKYGYENDNNLTLLELLHDNRIQQIIPPVKTILGRSSLRISDVCLVIYPFIEGVNGFSQKLTNAQWVTLGMALRQIHDFDVPPSLLKHISQETYSPKWRLFVRSLYDNIFDAQVYKDDVALKFLNFLNEHRSVIQRLVDRAEDLSYVAKEQSAKFVLCHSDIHGGNVLIKGSNAIYIVDWDEPIMAPKERDLMFIGGGIANVWNDLQEEVSFYKGYGNTDINMSILAYYRLERIVVDIAEDGEALLLSNFDNTPKSRLEMYKQFIGMFEPQGVVDIAFKTDALRKV